MERKKFIEMIETLEQHQPAIIGLNYDYRPASP
jgi:CHASE2 domain-containing sensor protein